MNRREFLITSAAVGFAAPANAAQGREELPFRQVHLDFHTSELIGDVGADFDAREFAATLKAARVNSINVFAKCHHGYAYYDTKLAARHPALKVDMLGQMIEACHANGIHVLYYYSLVWDVLASRRHPEWLATTREHQRIGGPPTDAWPWLCMNSPYLDQVAAAVWSLVCATNSTTTPISKSSRSPPAAGATRTSSNVSATCARWAKTWLA
ncbi:MAG: alpha-L-fucosidase [Bryobacterales bacterium]|nr:alpha-L-fucosidase [Bryobacterales bacterium]